MEQSNVKKVIKHKRTCKICNKTIIGGPYKFRSHLYQHNAIASRFQCIYCSKEYFRKDAYNKHMDTHHGTKKKYICDHCDRDFVDKRNLISHMQNVHDDYDLKKKAYTCKACGVKYCEERLLKYHIRKLHFNLQEKQANSEKKLNETWIERVLESDVCVQITKVNNNVISIKKCEIVDNNENKKKLGDWTKAEPFKEYINSVFAGIDKSQYSRAICDYCNKEMLKKSLQNHMREKHLKVRRFECENCKRSFYRHYQMMNHTCGQPMRRKQMNVKHEIVKNQEI
ncbi:hypothetical protein ACJJTC_015229 [Scirpophaga incertulas]